MKEALLQFIWQYSLYQPGALYTLEGEKITIIFPGRKNTDAGPDFLEAKIKIGDLTLVGNIELHIKQSDWFRHKHEDDPLYSKIILHVVYEYDATDKKFEHAILELKNHIPEYVLNQYTHLLETTIALPCRNQVHKVPEIVVQNWLQRMLAERWEQKLQGWGLIDKSNALNR